VLARAGRAVVGVDVQDWIVDALRAGRFPFEEPPMEEAFRHPAVRENFEACSEPRTADVFVIAVPTPLDGLTRTADLTFVANAARSLIPFLEPDILVVVESTVPPLTCREVIAPILAESGLEVGREILLAHCPERILPGDIMREIVENDRVIGGVTPEAARRAGALYASFVEGSITETDDVTAEMCKLMENTYRDVNVALANELASVCERLGISVIEAISLANRHPRVRLLTPGIGTGGHCVPVDPWFIHQVDPEHATLIETARRINMAVPEKIAAWIRRSVAHVPSPRIATVGASYKPDTADCRESPALEVVRSLQDEGYSVSQFDPLARGYPWPANGLVDAARDADCLAILVGHEVVRQQLMADRSRIESVMATPIILTFYDPAFEPARDPRGHDPGETGSATLSAAGATATDG